MKKKQLRKYSIWAIYIAIWLIFRNFPSFTERIYSRGIYPYIAKVLHLAFGWIPFSMGDVLYTLFIISLVVIIIKHFKKLWQEPLKAFEKIVSKTISIAFSFFLLWGFNYFRVPLATQLSINTQYTEAQLLEATEVCIENANALHKQLASTDTTKVDFRLSQKEIYCIAYENGYPLQKEKISDFKAIKSVKPSLYSKLLTYMGYSGYLNPFTNEAQVNAKMIGYSTPITVCHEIAHQMGYAAEEEANYLAFLATEKTQNPYFKYSATLFALRYFLNEIASVAPDKYEELYAKIRKGIFENYKEVRLFWQQYENKAAPVLKATYDAFLKANKQKEGINSYDLVVGLLIPHYKR